MNKFIFGLLIATGLMATGCKPGVKPLFSVNTIENNRLANLTVHRIPDDPLYFRIGSEGASVTHEIEMPCDIKLLFQPYGYRADFHYFDKSSLSKGTHKLFSQEEWMKPKGPPPFTGLGDDKVVTVLFHKIFCNAKGDPILSVHIFQKRDKMP